MLSAHIQITISLCLQTSIHSVHSLESISLENIAASPSTSKISFQGPQWRINKIKRAQMITIRRSLYLEVNSLRLTHGHIYSPWAHWLTAVQWIPAWDWCELWFCIHSNLPLCTQTWTHTAWRTHTHTPGCSVDSEKFPVPSSTARISSSDGWKLPSKPGPEGVQTVCLFEWTRHQSPIPSAMLIK